MRYFSLITFFIVLAFYSPSSQSADFNIEECNTSDFKSKEPIYAETEEERMIRMDQELIALLNQFEECVEATESSFSATSSQSTNSNSSASNSASGNEIIRDEKEQSPEVSPVSEDEKDSNLPDDDIKGDNGSTPKDIPDISTDDTTARQLRAEAEGTNDPVLKELYWDAYRQYKGIKPKKSKD
jgi:hypothetical protein